MLNLLKCLFSHSLVYIVFLKRECWLFPYFVCFAEKQLFSLVFLVKSFSFLFQSLNGVWLNCERIDPTRAHPLQEGDIVQLGVPLKHRDTAEYEYRLIKEEWKKISPFLAQKNDQLTDKTKDMRAKRKITLEDSEASGAEGPSNSRSKRDRISSENDSLAKSEGGRTELSKQPVENMDIVLLPPKPSKKEKKKNHCNPAQPEHGLCVISKDQKAPSLTPSLNGLEQIKKTFADMTKLKTKIQEKQTAVLNVRQKNKKCAPKEIQVLEQELQDLQDQICTEQEHQQQRVEQLEKTFYEELEVGAVMLDVTTIIMSFKKKLEALTIYTLPFGRKNMRNI